MTEFKADAAFEAGSVFAVDWPLCQVRLQDESTYSRSGSLDFTDNAIDTASGVIRLRAVVPNADGFLKRCNARFNRLVLNDLNDAKTSVSRRPDCAERSAVQHD